MFPKVPVALLVFLASFLAAPLIYTLDKMVVMQDHTWVFASGVIILPLFGLMSRAFLQQSPGRGEVLFYVWSIFSFTAVVDLFIALELDGYVKGFMEFYLREGEPYLRSSYGTMINWWDGIGHFAMYITMIALLCSGRSFRVVGLYWVGSIMNSMIVYMPGNVTGNKGLRWSYLLNVPYVVCPIYAGVRFIREGMRIKHKQPGRKQQWEKIADWTFCVWFVAAIGAAMFRMVSCMGCKDWISKFYVSEIEPYLVDPYQYGKTQALCYFYYFIPFYVAAICAHLYPGQSWIKDWSVIHAGASVQAQLIYIASSLKWRTAAEHIVPNTVLARSLFWTINLSLLIMPHLHALYCNRMEVGEFWAREVTPRLGKWEITPRLGRDSRDFVPPDRRASSPVRRNKIPVRQDSESPHRPVTRQQKKLM